MKWVHRKRFKPSVFGGFFAVCEDHFVPGAPDPASSVRQPRVLGLRLFPEGLPRARLARHC